MNKVLLLVLFLSLVGCDKIKDAKLKYSIKFLDYVSCKVKDSEERIILRNIKSLEVDVEFEKIKEKYEKTNEANNIISLASKNHKNEIILLNKKEGTLVKLNLDKNVQKYEKSIIQADCR